MEILVENEYCKMQSRARQQLRGMQGDFQNPFFSGKPFLLYHQVRDLFFAYFLPQR